MSQPLSRPAVESLQEIFDVVPAHSVSPFRIDATNQAWDIQDKVLFSVEATDNGYITPQIMGVNVRYVLASDGSAHVSGFIKNTGNSKITFPEVGIAYFDNRGTVLYFNSVYAETTSGDDSVGPGEQVLFFLNVDTVPAGAVSHRVYLDALQEAA